MSEDPICARNRANARRSTGPRSARGKAIVAGNARRHGATASPAPESIATWLSIILDRPEIGPDDLLPQDVRGFRARALADAEVRVVAAEHALRDFEASLAPSAIACGTPPQVLQAQNGDLTRIIDRMQDSLQVTVGTAMERRQAERLLAQIARLGKPARASAAAPDSEHRLLQRYLAEARSRRRGALAAWLSLVAVATKHGEAA